MKDYRIVGIPYDEMPEKIDELLGEVGDLQERIDKLQEENKRLKEEYILLQNASDEYEERLLNREAELLDRIDKAQIFIQQNIRDIDYDTEEYDYLMKILGGDVDDE